jgi:hypothetical protein
VSVGRVSDMQIWSIAQGLKSNPQA